MKDFAVTFTIILIVYIPITAENKTTDKNEDRPPIYQINGSTVNPHHILVKRCWNSVIPGHPTLAKVVIGGSFFIVAALVVGLVCFFRTYCKHLQEFLEIEDDLLAGRRCFKPRLEDMEMGFSKTTSYLASFMKRLKDKIWRRREEEEVEEEEEVVVEEEDEDIEGDQEDVDENLIAPSPGGLPYEKPIAPSPGGLPYEKPIAPSPGGLPYEKPFAPSPGGLPYEKPFAPSPGGLPYEKPIAPSPGGLPYEKPFAPSPGGLPYAKPFAPSPGGLPYEKLVTPSPGGPPKVPPRTKRERTRYEEEPEGESQVHRADLKKRNGTEKGERREKSDPAKKNKKLEDKKPVGKPPKNLGKKTLGKAAEKSVKKVKPPVEKKKETKPAKKPKKPKTPKPPKKK